MKLRATGVGREPRPFAQAIQTEAGRVDEMQRLAHLLTQSGHRLRDQPRKKSGKHLGAAKSVGVRKGRARHRARTQMVKSRRMALKRADDVPQTFGAGQLPVKQGQKLALGRQLAHTRIRAMLFHKTLECAPRKVLRDRVKYAILMPHGLASFSCPNPSPNDSNRGINAVRPVHIKLNRTAVGQARP